MSTLERTLLALAVALALSPVAAAADEPAQGDADTPAKPQSTAPGARKLARGPQPVDPMQDLRERLAAKLGATKTSDSKSEPAMTVSTQSDGHLQPTTQTDLQRKPPAKPAAAQPRAHREGHWSYDGETGPQAWGRLKPEFSQCASGRRQSPIDIRDGIRVDLEPVQFDYRPSGFGVLDNGHTVQVNVAPGNSIEVMGRRFELVQFHFHRPSEERITGKQFDWRIWCTRSPMAISRWWPCCSNSAAHIRWCSRCGTTCRWREARR
ncbi:MAG TPA: carbonic anhydrase family protein [Burkholderiaceae bacterium]|nr:carbonic anhydrase family protein [Burkholderiaceae bacterium]